PVAVILALGLVGGLVPEAAEASEPPSGGAPVEITATPAGRDLAARAVASHARHGVTAEAGALRVWSMGLEEFFVGTRLPGDFDTSIGKTRDGSTRLEVAYDVGSRGAVPRPHAATGAVGATMTAAGAVIPSWAFLDAGCFARLGGGSFGFLDACYSLHRLANETNSRDFYKLEQYGTLSAGIAAKIYSGWMAASKASSGSGAMSWVDWSPRGNVKGGCQNLTLKIEALGVSFTSPAYFCEDNIPTKYEAAGSFRMEWSCGCIYPFGQPYPNSREIDYLQTVSVANGKPVRWTISAGYLAR
ncbi:MAG: hypothetical protein ACRDIL_12595, partial [Candidatus Limnocylindrales bacterium]